MTTLEDVRAQILSFVGASPNAPDGFDLRRDGAVDSLRFIQLIGHLEARIGTTIDLADVDPERLTNLAVLSSHIAKQVGTVSITE
jgi:acyl carrier protein